MSVQTASDPIREKQRQEIATELNELTVQKCPGCEHSLGASTEIWECQHPLPLAVEALVTSAVVALDLGCCVRCSKLSWKPWDEMVREPGHMVYSRRRPGEILEFCWPCHHLSYDNCT